MDRNCPKKSIIYNFKVWIPKHSSKQSIKTTIGDHVGEEHVHSVEVNMEDVGIKDNKSTKCISSFKKARSVNRFAILADSCTEVHSDNSNIERDL